MSQIQNDRSKKPGVPRPVYVLGAGIVVLGTTEFMIAGLLPAIAGDLGVSIPQAGLLISAFAIGMVIGAPAMTILTLGLPRKTTLLAALTIFVAAHALSAVAPTYTLLLAARVITALATGAFWAVAAVVTVSSVPTSIRARALAILVGGLTVANVAGVPLGALVGQQLGWRASFWTVGALAVVALIGIVAAVPHQPRAHSGPKLGAELSAFRSTRLWVALATTALFQASVFGAFSYLAPMLTEVSGLAESAIPGVLAAFGIGSIVGSQLGGRFADRYPWHTLFIGLSGLAVNLGALALAATWPIPTVALVFTLGLVGFTLAAPLNARVFALAGPAPTLASATNTSAFNVGNTLGPWMAGAAISSGFGYVAPTWVGILLVGGAIALGLTSYGLDRRSDATAVTATTLETV